MDNYTVAILISIVLSLSFYSPSCLLIVFFVFIHLFSLFSTLNYQYTLADSRYESSSILAHLGVNYLVALDNLFPLPGPKIGYRSNRAHGGYLTLSTNPTAYIVNRGIWDFMS
ncbi:hypothetical protein BDV24DRAFT_7853 [Aspergillus arachidicola]|uniref:Uncharacterized protein n=1 Tax=Aspergillus arachidicola TaxID=656916 RepID=A0A5N6XQH6_9EURO|nr:hypothetical protein BDV24DRAFT_7853 [Aspergillus arachidicola]